MNNKVLKVFSLYRTLWLAETTMPHEYFPTCSISLKNFLAVKLFFISVSDVVTSKIILHCRRRAVVVTRALHIFTVMTAVWPKLKSSVFTFTCNHGFSKFTFLIIIVWWKINSDVSVNVVMSGIPIKRRRGSYRIISHSATPKSCSLSVYSCGRQWGRQTISPSAHLSVGVLLFFIKLSQCSAEHVTLLRYVQGH